MEIIQNNNNCYADLILGKNYSGFPDIVHGGIQAAILDEVAFWAMFNKYKSIGFTTNMNIQYLNKMDVNKRIEYWKKKLGSNFFLFIGAERYYKGLKIALQAVENTNIKMVFAGALQANKDLAKYMKSKSMKNIKILGEISKEDKCALLKLTVTNV